MLSPSLETSVSQYILFVAIQRNKLIESMLEDEENMEFLDNYKFKKRESNLYSKFIKLINMHSRSENFLHSLVNEMELDFKAPEISIIE